MAEAFVVVVLVLAALVLLANVLLWVPFVGKVFWAIGKVLGWVGFIVGLLCLWAVGVLLGWLPAPF